MDFGDDGYTLDPDRTIDGMVLANRDRAEAVAGGRSRYPDSVIASVENTCDLFGEVNALTTAYGIVYAYSERTVSTGAVETGLVTGDPTGDVNCTALSLGARHDEDKAVSMRGCVEVINDVSTKGTSNALIFTGLAHYKV